MLQTDGDNNSGGLETFVLFEFLSTIVCSAVLALCGSYADGLRVLFKKNQKRTKKIKKNF